MTESKPLHPTSLLFQFSAIVKQLFVPVILVAWNAAKGSWMSLLGMAALSLVFIAISLVRYLTFRYQLLDRELIVTEGLIFRSRRNVPVDRIQNVDMLQNIFHRMLGVAEVKIETASGTKPEAVMKVLSLTEVRRLQSQIESVRSAEMVIQSESSSESADEIVGTEPSEPEEQLLLKIPAGLLVRAGLASNRGFVMVGILLGLFFQQNPDRNFRWDKHFENLFEQAAWLGSWGVVVALVVAVLVVIRLLGTAWYLLRFYGYELRLRDENLRLSCGALTKVSATVPRRRIQLISVHRTWLQRRLGIASVRIETAGGAGNQNENAATTVTRRWFIPVISESQLNEVVSQLRAGLVWDETELPWRSLPTRALKRLRRKAAIKAAVLSLGGYGLFFAVSDSHLGWLAGPLYLPLGLLRAQRLFSNTALTELASEQGLAFRSGVWTIKTSMTFFDRVQTVTLRETPFDRRWRMKSLHVDTAASGPANHVIAVGMLNAGQAEQELERIADATARVKLTWD